MSGTRKVAILLSILGDESAATILKDLPEEELQRVTDEVAGLTAVPFETALLVLEEFQQILVAQDFIAVGGHDVATRLLIKAFGENGAKGMLQRLMRTDEVNSMRMDSLKRADPQQLARFLVGEHAQTKALGAADEARARCSCRLCQTAGEHGTVFSGCCDESLYRVESPIAVCWRPK
jgi:flagellar motor switch protein FliG